MTLEELQQQVDKDFKLDDTELDAESIKIPLGARHRAWNETDELVQFIEVQTGTYFGEDDIVRIEDDYNRK